MQTPCKNCQDREALCHTFCPKYKEFTAKVEEIRTKKARENDKYNHPKRSQKERMRRMGIK